MTAVHFTALCIALAIAAITAITIILAVDTANSRARVTRGHIAFRDLPGDEDGEAMWHRWLDEPGTVRDAEDQGLERWLTEGNEHP